VILWPDEVCNPSPVPFRKVEIDASPFIGISYTFPYMWKGVSTVVNVTEPRILNAQVTEDEIIAHLVDGRTISVPLIWFWRLAEATENQRQNFEILGDCQGIHWPEIDEDISAEGMLYGSPARRPYNPSKQAA
jgi:hypothetical protein